MCLHNMPWKDMGVIEQKISELFRPVRTMYKAKLPEMA